MYRSTIHLQSLKLSTAEPDSQGIKEQKLTSPSPQKSDEDHELSATGDKDGELPTTGGEDDELSTTGDEDDELSTTENEDDELSTTEDEDEPTKRPLAGNPENLILTCAKPDDFLSFNLPPHEADYDDELSTTGNEDGPSSKRVTKNPEANNKETKGSTRSQQRGELDYVDDELPSTCSEDKPPRIQSEAKPESPSSLDAPSILRTKANQAPSPNLLERPQTKFVSSSDDSLKRTAQDLIPSIPSKRPKHEVCYQFTSKLVSISDMLYISGTAYIPPSSVGSKTKL